MRFLVAAIVCIVALYALDNYFFNGAYFSAMSAVLSGILRQWH